MARRGFTYYDWNVSAQDATGKSYSSQDILNFVLPNAKSVSRSIVLMHDSASKYQTVRALPAMIDGLVKAGYSLQPLSNDVEPIIFGYRK
jgi:peptidoglycan/xylan/chitin deacetylase (PgdA/CDA1 family)